MARVNLRIGTGFFCGDNAMAKKKTYILEHDNPDFWRTVRYCAEVEGVSIKGKIIELLRQWVDSYSRIISVVQKSNHKK